MKKYLIVVRDKNVLKALNDKVAVYSLFSVGETITNSPLLFGENYTSDKRVYETAKEFSKTHEDVFTYDLTHFVVYGCKVELTEGSITVNGFKMSLRYKYGYTIKAYKSYIGTSDVSRFAYTLLDDMWSDNVKNLFTHIQKYGKKVTNN